MTEATTLSLKDKILAKLSEVHRSVETLQALSEEYHQSIEDILEEFPTDLSDEGDEVYGHLVDLQEKLLEHEQAGDAIFLLTDSSTRSQVADWLDAGVQKADEDEEPGE